MVVRKIVGLFYLSWGGCFAHILKRALLSYLASSAHTTAGGVGRSFFKLERDALRASTYVEWLNSTLDLASLLSS